MKLVLLAQPFHSFTLTERLDRNGIVGIFNERIYPSSQNTTARIYCCKSPMKSLGGIFERKQCLHIARRTRRKFQLQFEPPCWKHHMLRIKGLQWLMGFSNREQRRKKSQKKKNMLSDVTRLMSVMGHRVNVYQLYPDLYPLPRNCEKWRSQPSHTITSRMTNPTPHARTHTQTQTHTFYLSFTKIEVQL